jgi:tRNA pseudouridine38-40 synthase
VRNLRLTVQYDGTRYQGWQRLGSGGESRTIQGRLEAVLGRLTGERIAVIGASRTDAGAHAEGQVANFHTASQLSAGAILEALGKYLPSDIVVSGVDEAEPRFHARYLARSKLYVYRVCNRRVPDVLRRGFALHVPSPLDVGGMRHAGSLLVGKHDFLAFSSVKGGRKSTARTLLSLDLVERDGRLDFLFEGDGFLYNMIRIITGTLLEVGAGARNAGDVARVLASRSRAEAGPTAPAHGLCLLEVRY